MELGKTEEEKYRHQEGEGLEATGMRTRKDQRAKHKIRHLGMRQLVLGNSSMSTPSLPAQ